MTLPKDVKHFGFPAEASFISSRAVKVGEIKAIAHLAPVSR